MSCISVLVVAAALGTAVAFHLGQRANRRLAVEIARVLEQSFHPESTSYTNIGGVIGYHLAYDMRPPWVRIEGTITLRPRQAVLYLPISRLLGREDTLQLTLLPSTPPMGEGHVLDEQALPRLRPDGLEETQKRTVEAGGRRFLVLFYNQQLGERLEAFVQALPRPDCLRHLACSGPHESLQVVLRADPQALVAILPYLHAALLQFGSSL